MPRRGLVAFQDPTYPVFRDVVALGCDNTGVTDVTDCINQVIQLPGNRCGGGDASNGSYCDSSTITPALVFFPSGTYRVSGPLVQYYGTQFVGDATNLPIIKVDPSYSLPGFGIAVMDVDIYIPGGYGAEWYASQNNFFRQIRNFVIDMTEAPLNAAGIHWQVAQATHLNNVYINMRSKDETNNQQEGIHMEDGSGGFMSDIYIDGGLVGARLGSQQFTSRNLQISNSATGIYLGFDWLWLFTKLNITGCNIGIDMTVGGFSNQAVGSVVVLDSIISATQGILTPYAPGYSSPQSAGTLILENVDFRATLQAVAAAGGTSAREILAGGQIVQLWAQGNAWTTAGQALDGQTFNGTTCTYQNTSQTGHTAQETTIQQQLAAVTRPSSLVDDQGQYFARSKPQYEDRTADQVLSAKAFGLVGDGFADDTDLMNAFLQEAIASDMIAYFDKGAYLVSDTINVPATVKIVGELYSIIMGTGSNFQDQNNPRPLFKVGDPGDAGTVEISDIMFETKGPTPGMIVVQWNVIAASQGSTGMWDAHFRIGATAGTEMQMDVCMKNPGVPVTLQDTTPCTATFLLLHVTPQSNGYFENVWGWVSDHELDMGNRSQVNIYNGRGFLIEGEGPNWFYGTSSEHHQLYSYQFSNAKNVFAGHIQQETAYYQGNPNALVPFTPQASWGDPTFADCTQANCARTWGLRVINSSDIFIYASGLYNFFDNYNTPICLGTESCQQHMVDLQNSTNVYLWALNTKGSSYMINYEGSDLLAWQVNQANFCATVVLFELAED